MCTSGCERRMAGEGRTKSQVGAVPVAVRSVIDGRCLASAFGC